MTLRSRIALMFNLKTSAALDQVEDLLAAERRLGQAIDQRLAAKALDRARRTALEAELHVDD